MSLKHHVEVEEVTPKPPIEQCVRLGGQDSCHVQRAISDMARQVGQDEDRDIHTLELEVYRLRRSFDYLEGSLTTEVLE
ncbi:MAG: hypothetical protein QM784_09950 [Polyangiaceae bacterium]